MKFLLSRSAAVAAAELFGNFKVMKRFLFLFAFAPFFLNSCRYDHVPEPVSVSCDSAVATYNATIVPILQEKCYACHSGAVISGGVDLGVYNNVKFYSDEGSLWSVTSRDHNFPPMPPDAANKLDECQLAKVKKWINTGAPDN